MEHTLQLAPHHHVSEDLPLLHHQSGMTTGTVIIIKNSPPHIKLWYHPTLIVITIIPGLDITPPAAAQRPMPSAAA
jgi:hypothetical protein